MQEHVVHNSNVNEHGAGPHVVPADASVSQAAGSHAFPGTEAIESQDGGQAAEPRKPSWAERRAARRADAGSETASRLPSWLTWDLRAKLAVVLSFVILVSVLIWNRPWLKGKDTKPETSPNKLVAQIPPANPGDPDGKESKPKATEPKPTKDESPPSEPAAQSAVPKSDSPPALPKDDNESPPAAVPTASPNPLDQTPPPIAQDKGTEQAKPDKPASPLADEPPPMQAVPSPSGKPKDLVVSDAPSEIPPKPVETPPKADSASKPADVPPKIAETPPKIGEPETPPAAEPKPTAVAPTEAPKGPVEAKPAEPTPSTMPQLAPTPSTADSSRDQAIASPAPELATGGGYSIPNAGLVRTSTVNGSKSASPSNETVLATAPATARSVPVTTGANASAPMADGTVHIVRRGENFWTISRYHYGSGRFYMALWYANRDLAKAPADLYVGTPIRIPDVDDLNREYIEAPKTARTGAKPSAESTPALTVRDSKTRKASAGQSSLITLPPAAESEEMKLIPKSTKLRNVAGNVGPKLRTYVVRGRHETLRSIAARELGDADLEDEIYRLNQDQFDEDSSKLRVGMALKIPEDTRTK